MIFEQKVQGYRALYLYIKAKNFLQNYESYLNKIIFCAHTSILYIEYSLPLCTYKICIQCLFYMHIT